MNHILRSLIVPSTLLGTSLAIAWSRYTAEPDLVGDNEVLVMANQSSQISLIQWTSTEQSVRIERKEDTLGSYLWVEYTDKKLPDDPQTKYFKASQNGDKLLETLSPLVGIRKLDSNIDLDSIGLTTPSATMEITSNGKTRTFAIGDEAYGTRDLYVRDESSQEIFLVDDNKLRNLRQARTSLPDRALFGMDLKTVSSAILKYNDRILELSHQNWQGPAQAQWINPSFPEEDTTQLQTWMSKLLRTSVSQYAAPDEDLSTLEERLEVTLTWDNGQSETAIYAYDATNDRWWAKSDSTRSMVRLTGNGLTSLLEDLPTLSGN